MPLPLITTKKNEYVFLFLHISQNRQVLYHKKALFFLGIWLNSLFYCFNIIVWMIFKIITQWNMTTVRKQRQMSHSFLLRSPLLWDKTSHKCIFSEHFFLSRYVKKTLKDLKLDKPRLMSNPVKNPDDRTSNLLYEICFHNRHVLDGPVCASIRLCPWSQLWQSHCSSLSRQLNTVWWKYLCVPEGDQLFLSCMLTPALMF